MLSFLSNLPLLSKSQNSHPVSENNLKDHQCAQSFPKQRNRTFEFRSFRLQPDQFRRFDKLICAVPCKGIIVSVCRRVLQWDEARLRLWLRRRCGCVSGEVCSGGFTRKKILGSAVGFEVWKVIKIHYFIFSCSTVFLQSNRVVWSCFRFRYG